MLTTLPYVYWLSNEYKNPLIRIHYASPYFHSFWPLVLDW